MQSTSIAEAKSDQAEQTQLGSSFVERVVGKSRTYQHTPLYNGSRLPSVGTGRRAWLYTLQVARDESWTYGHAHESWRARESEPVTFFPIFPTQLLSLLFLRTNPPPCWIDNPFLLPARVPARHLVTEDVDHDYSRSSVDPRRPNTHFIPTSSSFHRRKPGFAST